MGNFTKKESDEAAPFNMAALFYLEIHKIRERKSIAMIENDLPTAYDCLQELLTLAHVKLNNKEITKIEKFLSDAKKEYEKEDGKRNLGTIKTHLIKADRKLLINMNKYSMIFPRIEMTGGLESIRKKYDLGEKK